MCASALADFSASLRPGNGAGCESFWMDVWLTGNLPPYLSPFVDDATDDEDDVDEFDGSGMLVVVVDAGVDDDDGGGAIRRLLVVVVVVANELKKFLLELTEEYSECADDTDLAGLDCLDWKQELAQY